MAETPHAGSDQHNPDWKQFPNLDGVITSKDVDAKGSEKFKAEYINWCKAAQLLRTHAKGWQFVLRTTFDVNGHETDVFRAPNGTGYLKGFFRAPIGSGFPDTPDFPQAIMDNRNQPKQWDHITARDVTDTHRRCMCTAAAAQFGLAWQLWAKVDIENPMRGEEPAPSTKAAPVKRSSAKTQNNQPTQANESDLPKRVAEELWPEFQKYERGDINPLLNEWKRQYKDAYRLTPDLEHITSKMIQTEEQFNWTKKFIEINTAPQAK